MNYGKKGLIVITVLGLLMVSGLVSKAIYFPGTAKAAEESKERTLEVGGQGLVMVKPDIALISFGVMTRNKAPKVAQGENAQLMDKVIKRLATLNIQPADIKTTGYYMNPDIIYDNSTRKERIVSYHVNNQVQVTVRDVTKAGEVLDGVVQEGVNNANGIQFGVSEEKRVEHYHQALAAALSSAKDKAKVMAKAMEITIDKPKRIVEDGDEATVLHQDVCMIKEKAIQ